MLLLEWLRGFGLLDRVGVEGTGSYGSGLAHHLRVEGVTVVDGKPTESSESAAAPGIEGRWREIGFGGSHGLRLCDYRKRLGVVFQDEVLFEGRVT